ncbi:MAG TPA: hypothetical protein VLG09_05900 [Candidatus Saccharimonadales bacterium]|nr:hypothetical protein [Candidatus Saccharimonadales bacterium]
MIKLESMWWHESSENGKLASSHIAVSFCALVRCGMIIEDLLEMEFEGIPNSFDDESISPMEYGLAYTDGEIFDIYIKPKYRKAVSGLFDSNKLIETMYSLEEMRQDSKNPTYTIECTWHNVDVLADWLQEHVA